MVVGILPFEGRSAVPEVGIRSTPVVRITSSLAFYAAGADLKCFLSLLGPPVARPFANFLGGGFPLLNKNRLQKKSWYPCSNLSTGGPSLEKSIRFCEIPCGVLWQRTAEGSTSCDTSPTRFGSFLFEGYPFWVSSRVNKRGQPRDFGTQLVPIKSNKSRTIAHTNAIYWAPQFGETSIILSASCFAIQIDSEVHPPYSSTVCLASCLVRISC